MGDGAGEDDAVEDTERAGEVVELLAQRTVADHPDPDVPPAVAPERDGPQQDVDALLLDQPPDDQYVVALRVGPVGGRGHLHAAHHDLDGAGQTELLAQPVAVVRADRDDGVGRGQLLLEVLAHREDVRGVHRHRPGDAEQCRQAPRPARGRPGEVRVDDLDAPAPEVECPPRQVLPAHAGIGEQPPHAQELRIPARMRESEPRVRESQLWSRAGGPPQQVHPSHVAAGVARVHRDHLDLRSLPAQLGDLQAHEGLGQHGIRRRDIGHDRHGPQRRR